jgi:stage V sporulation protein B
MKRVMGIGTIYLMIAQFNFLICNYIIYIGLGRFLGPETYGTFGVVMSVYMIITAILTNGIPRATSKLIAESKSAYHSLKSASSQIQVVLSVIMAMVLIIFSKPIALVLNDLSLIKYIIIVGVMTIPFGLYTLQMSGFLNGLKLFKYQASTSVVHDVSRLFLVFIFVVIGLKITGTLAGYFIATIIGLLVALKFLHVKNQKGSQASRKSNQSTRIISCATPLLLIALGFTLMRNVNILFLKSMILEGAQLGYYTAASALSNVPFMIFSALPATLLPSISASFADGNIGLTKKYISQSLRYLFLLLLPLVAIIAGTSTRLVALFYGAAYRPAGIALAILVLASFSLSIFMALGSILIGTGQSKKKLWIVIVTIILMVTLNFLFIPKYGIIGGALTSLIASTVAAIIAGIVVYHKFESLISAKSFLRISFCSGIVLLAAHYWNLSGIYLMINYIVLGGLYLFLLWSFGEISKEDYKVVRGMIGREYNK